MQRFLRGAVLLSSIVTAFTLGCDGGGGTIKDTDKVAAMLSVCPTNPVHGGIGSITQTLDIIELLDTNTLDTDALITKAMYLCMVRATDCASFKLCYEPSADMKTAACTTDKTSACSGDNLIRCNPSATDFPPLEMCGNAGLQCITLGKSAECGIETCTGPQLVYCEGDKLFQCELSDDGTTGALYLRDCRHEGGTCGQTTAGAYDCIGTGAACTTSETLHCDGQYMVACMNGKETKYDCKKLSQTYTCNTDATLGALCGETTPVCDRHTNESCGSDGVINFCYFGKTAKLNCRDYGFTGCATTTVDSQTLAFCNQ